MATIRTTRATAYLNGAEQEILSLPQVYGISRNEEGKTMIFVTQAENGLNKNLGRIIKIPYDVKSIDGLGCLMRSEARKPKAEAKLE